MRKRLLSLFLVLLLLPAAALADALPPGVWQILEDSLQVYTLTQEYILTDAQRAIAQSGQLYDALALPVALHPWQGEEEVFPAGLTLTAAQVRLLFPEAALLFIEPDPKLTLFELTGTWYAREDGVICYNHSEDTRDLTYIEVMDALVPESNSYDPIGTEKVVYLTIDDAPSKYTVEMLAMLRAYHVPATFFVVGAYVRQNPLFARAMAELGHTLANHSYNHKEEILTASFSSCLSDFRRTERAVEEALGYPLAMPILRVPYGASTIPGSYRTQLQQNGYYWMDWNALNGDAESNRAKTEDQLYERAVSTGRRYSEVVMLVHDGKMRTITSLPRIIEYFRENGYAFRAVTTDALDHYMDGVRMGFPK